MTQETFTGKPSAEIVPFPVRDKPPSALSDLVSLSATGVTVSSIMITPCINVAVRGLALLRMEVGADNVLDFDALLERIAKETTDPHQAMVLEAVRVLFKVGDVKLHGDQAAIFQTNLCPEVFSE